MSMNMLECLSKNGKNRLRFTNSNGCGLELVRQGVLTQAKQAGFTMIEILVTIAIAGILMGVAFPSFSNAFQNTKIRSQTTNLFFDLNYARSEAVKRDATVTVCASSDKATCSNAANWATGWIVATPTPGGGVGGALKILRTAPAVAATTNMLATVTNNIFVFQPDGSVSYPGLVVVCDGRGSSFARDVEVLVTGRSEASRTPGATVSGSALVCS